MSYVSDYRIERFKRTWSKATANWLTLIGFVMLALLILSAIFAPFLAPYPEHRGSVTDYENDKASPNADNVMGTDMNGRDIFSRVLFGARISLMIGVGVLSIAITLGTTLGLVAGYVGGKTNAIIMRTADIFLSIPAILLAMVVTAAVGATLQNVMLAIAFAWWPWYTRLIQGETISVMQEEYIEASQSIGKSRFSIIFRDVLPNVMAPLTVKATLDMGFVILVAAGLAFIGLGAQPPTPAWGTMIADGRSFIQTQWWISTFPGLAISYTVITFNLIGDGLRDVLDVEVE